MRSGIPGATFGLANTAETYMGSGGPGAVWQSGATGSLPAFGVPSTAPQGSNSGFNPWAYGWPGGRFPYAGMGQNQMATGMPTGMAGYAGLPFNYAGFGYGGLGSQMAGEEGHPAGGQAGNNFSTASGQGNNNSMTTSGSSSSAAGGSGRSGGSSSGGSGGSAFGGSGVARGYGAPAGGGGGGSASGGGGSGNQASSGYGNSSGGLQRTGRLQQNRRGGDHFLADVLSANGLPNEEGSLHWPLGLLGLPDASGDTLRRQVDTALTMAADRQERGQTSADVLRKVRPALRRLQRMLYEKEGEIPEQEYQECTHFLRKLSRAVRDLE
jgi:hypothetical protein